MKELFSNTYVRYGLVAFVGIFVGWLFFHSPHKAEEKHQDTAQSNKATIWTCAMHPQIRMSAPGKCPICGMELIPLTQENSVVIDPDAIHLNKESAQLANVLTSVVSRQKPIKEVRLYGKVQADERLLQTQVAHLPGRIEKLMVNFTGEKVRKGQTLALIYSPDLITAQQELLEAAKMKQSQPEIYEAAKEKLRQWMLMEHQIAMIENSGKVQTNFDVMSNTSGVVVSRRVNNGDHVAEGTILYDIADLSHIWVMFDAYESDLPFLTIGDKMNFTVQALPGIKLTGNITFIDPVLDPITRVAKVRVEINNESARLKPEMFATGTVNADLTEYKNSIIIPRSAVLWTGKRSIVYVKQPGTDEPIFKIREIELGPMLGSSYVVENGLKDGEEIVTQGTFSVDAAAQLEGKPSMMDQEAKSAPLSHNPKYDGEMTSTEPKFKAQLTTIYKQYLGLKSAFVASNPKLTAENAGKVKSILVKVDMRLLSGNKHQDWMDQSIALKEALEKIITESDIGKQREAFASFNLTFYNVLKTYGLEGIKTYYQYCPMAIGNKGAYWFSDTKVIRNPYFGEKMIGCGETRDTLQ